MRGIDEAQEAYHLELVRLSALVQSALERAEDYAEGLEEVRALNPADLEAL